MAAAFPGPPPSFNSPLFTGMMMKISTLTTICAAALLLCCDRCRAEERQPTRNDARQCPELAAQATLTCLGAVRGILSPSPVDRFLGIVAAPACLQQTYDAAFCYGAQQQPPHFGRQWP